MPEDVSGFKGYDFERPILDLEDRIRGLQETAQTTGMADLSVEMKALEDRCDELKKEIYQRLTPWQRVQMARHPRRPYTSDYVERLLVDFVQLHGDRHYSDDKAVVAGLGSLDGISVAVIGHQKGRTVQESMARNFGMPHPEGYRKALRVMELAGRFGLPVITLIDTAGAYPGIGAEERGQALAIADNLRLMARLPVPILCCVIGEGGSGGALAIGVGDRLLMLENAWYSVISPEGCASILYRDAAKAPEAAQALKLTAGELKNLGVVDEIVPEPLGGAHRDYDAAAQNLKGALVSQLKTLRALKPRALLDARYEKYRSIGQFDVQSRPRAIPSPRRKRINS